MGKLWVGLLVFVLAHQAIADDQIQGLNLDSTKFNIHIENAGFPSQKVVAVLNGDFEGEQRALIDQGRNVIAVSLLEHAKKTFQLPVTLTSSQTEVHLLAVDAFGKIEKETITLSYPEYEAVVSAAGEISSLGQGFGIQIGMDFIDYSQTGLSPFSESFLNLMVSYQRPLGRDWDFAVNSSLDVVQLGASLPETSIRFLRFNARAGYSLLHSDHWSLSMAGGTYYNTTLDSGNYGFHNFYGPELFPILRYSLGFRDSFGLFYKYSPILSHNLSFSSYDEVVGVNWTRALPKKKTMTVSFQFVKDFIDLPSMGTQCNADSVDLSFEYGF